jgi:hypothetical protein
MANQPNTLGEVIQTLLARALTKEGQVGQFPTLVVRGRRYTLNPETPKHLHFESEATFERYALRFDAPIISEDRSQGVLSSFVVENRFGEGIAVDVHGGFGECMQAAQ